MGPKTNVITTVHAGITITYNQDSDRWEFELRGKERHATTLTLAKQAIDKPAPVDKKPFTPLEVYTSLGYGIGYVPAVITALAPSTYRYGKTDAWIKYVDKHNQPQRRKVSLDGLKKRNAHNESILAELDKTHKAIDNLSAHAGKLITKLEDVTIKPEDYD